MSALTKTKQGEQGFWFSVLAVSVAMLAASCAPAPDMAGLDGMASTEGETDDVASTADELVSNKASVWFPIQEGNTWSLRSTTGNAVRSVSLESVQDGIGWLDGLSPNGGWVGVSKSSPNTLYAWSEQKSSWAPFIRFGYTVTGWKFGFADGPCSTFNVKRVASDITVTTPAGTFTNARTIRFEQVGGPTVRCAAPLYRELTFAPEVGIIAIVSGADERFTLTSAKVNGKKYPLATTTPTGQVRGTLRTDKVSYTSKPNTIACITTPCPNNADTATATLSYTVTNGTNQSVTWQFTSGCQFDVELRDVNGSVVRRLSDGRFCTLALTNFTLAPGASKTFTADLELTDSDGLQLEGTFTARASLIPKQTSPGATANSQSFKVSIVR